MLGEKTVIGSFNGSDSLQVAIPKLAELVADGTLTLEPLITETRELAEIDEAMDGLNHWFSIHQTIKP